MLGNPPPTFWVGGRSLIQFHGVGSCPLSATEPNANKLITLTGMKIRRTTTTLVLLASLVIATIGFRLDFLFRTEVKITRDEEFQTRYVWGFPSLDSIRPANMSTPRVGWRYERPTFKAGAAAFFGLAPSQRHPSTESDWLVDGDRDGTFDLRIEGCLWGHPLISYRAVYVRRSPDEKWRAVTGQDAEDVFEAVQLVTFSGTTDFGPEPEGDLFHDSNLTRGQVGVRRSWCWGRLRIERP